MTTVTFYRRNGFLSGIRVAGHSGYADAGSDVVCAAVSVLVQALHIGLSDVLGQEISPLINAEDAVIEYGWNRETEHSVQVLCETIARTFYETAQSYGSYVKYVEVSL